MPEPPARSPGRPAGGDLVKHRRAPSPARGTRHRPGVSIRTRGRSRRPKPARPPRPSRGRRGSRAVAVPQSVPGAAAARRLHRGHPAMPRPAAARRRGARTIAVAVARQVTLLGERLAIAGGGIAGPTLEGGEAGLEHTPARRRWRDPGSQGRRRRRRRSGRSTASPSHSCRPRRTLVQVGRVAARPAAQTHGDFVGRRMVAAQTGDPGRGARRVEGHLHLALVAGAVEDGEVRGRIAAQRGPG